MKKKVLLSSIIVFSLFLVSLFTRCGLTTDTSGSELEISTTSESSLRLYLYAYEDEEVAAQEMRKYQNTCDEPARYEKIATTNDNSYITINGLTPGVKYCCWICNTECQVSFVITFTAPEEGETLEKELSLN